MERRISREFGALLWPFDDLLRGFGLQTGSGVREHDLRAPQGQYVGFLLTFLVGHHDSDRLVPASELRSDRARVALGH